MLRYPGVKKDYPEQDNPEILPQRSHQCKF